MMVINYFIAVRKIFLHRDFFRHYNDLWIAPFLSGSVEGDLSLFLKERLKSECLESRWKLRSDGIST